MITFAQAKAQVNQAFPDVPPCRWLPDNYDVTAEELIAFDKRIKQQIHEARKNNQLCSMEEFLSGQNKLKDFAPFSVL